MISETIYTIIIKRILDKYPDTESIWVYGSQARGTATDSSDIDICVKMPTGMHVLRHDDDLRDELSKAIGKEVNPLFSTKNNAWMEKQLWGFPRGISIDLPGHK